jgi:hypothetical protein
MNNEQCHVMKNRCSLSRVRARLIAPLQLLTVCFNIRRLVRARLIAPLAIILIALGGCQKYDDGALWNEVNSQAERLAALETWQTAVNSNIAALQELVSALQTRRYITGVSEFTMPAPGGYAISFNTGAPVTIKHGAKGATGNTGATGATGDTPQIGVAEYPAGSGAYYWMLNGAFIEANGQKLPVTVDGDPGDSGQPGAPGVTPKLRINAATNCWQVCTTGACNVQADAGWEDVLGSNGQPVEATGATDVIFASGGVDYANDDYVEFTLADGVTKIQVPKYRPLGITFTAPGAFAKGEVKTVAFAVTGPVQSITALDIPAGWTVTPDLAAHAITITAPAANAINYTAAGTVTLLVSDGATRTFTKPLALECPEHTDLLDIHFTPPQPFIYGATGAVTYTTTGGAITVKVLGVPAGWTVNVTHTGITGIFNITAPAHLTVSQGEAAVLLLDAAGKAITRPLGLRLSFYPASAQTWTFGASTPTLTWSDAIRAVECDKESFLNSDTEPQCRSYIDNNYKRYYYNWPYVIANAATLCPSPWRVPSKDDFDILAAATNPATLHQAWWGYGGNVGSSGMNYVTTQAYYWSSTEYLWDQVYYLLYEYGSDGVRLTYNNKRFGLQVRCVK